MALIAVLWIVGLLALVAAGAGSSSRVSSQLAFNAVENAKAGALAKGGVNRAVFSLLDPLGLRERAVDGALYLSYRTASGRVVVQVRDEDGKIDVNGANRELLQGLLIAVGLEDGDAARSLAERIIDYREGNQDRLPDGADRPIRHLGELRSVLGMTADLHERLQPHLTIYADAEGFDPFWASDAALAALPGMTSDARSMLRAADIDRDVLSILPGDVGVAIENYILPSRELVFEVRALARTDGGGGFLLETVVALDGGQGRRPFTTFAWRQGTPFADDPLLAMMQGKLPSP